MLCGGQDLVPDASNLLSKDVAIHEESDKENGHQGNGQEDEDDEEIGPSLPKASVQL
mgnify:FL=1